MLRERASLWTDRLLLLLLQSICRHYQINLSGFNMQCENAARVFKAAIRVYSFMPAFIFHCCFSTGRTVGILKLKNACSLLHACSFWLYLKALKQLVFRDLGNVASLFLSITDSSNSYSLLATIFRIELKMWVWFYKKGLPPPVCSWPLDTENHLLALVCLTIKNHPEIGQLWSARPSSSQTLEHQNLLWTTWSVCNNWRTLRFYIQLWIVLSG